MSDFDTVLERLVADPAFASILAADPARALAGYRLSPDEVALLHSQVTSDTGGQIGGVETRANQSSVFGLLGIAGLAGAAGAAGAMLGSEAARQGFGPAEPGGHGGSSDLGAGPEPRQGFGVASQSRQGFGPGVESRQGFGVASEPRQGFGVASQSRQGFGPGAQPSEGFGAAQVPEAQGIAGAVARAADAASGARGVARVPGAVQGAMPSELPEGYRTSVDADGDGDFDRYTLRPRRAGVDILVDTDADGRVDFVGHDRDADGLVDSAEFDHDGDGHFEQHSYDSDGDGLLDRSWTRAPRPGEPPFGNGTAGNSS